MILDPPLFESWIRTVTVTFPDLAEEVIEITVGADGLVMAAWAFDANEKPIVSANNEKIRALDFTTKSYHIAVFSTTLAICILFVMSGA